MAIQDFFDAKTKEKSKSTNRAVRYQKESQGMTESEKRNLEMELLIPEKIPAYTHEKTDYDVFSPIAGGKVIMIFPDKESLAMFTKHFKVSKHIEPSLTGMAKLLAVVKLLEDGLVVYDPKTNIASVKCNG